MATIKDSTLKFLNLEQLGLLVTNIKNLIGSAKTSTTISSVAFTPADGKITITQGEGEGATNKDVTLPKLTGANDDNLGLLSNKQYKTITDGITGVTTTANSAVQWVGTVSGGTTSIYTPLVGEVTVDGKKYKNVAAIQLVDDLVNADANQKLRAPSTSGVLDAIAAESTILQDAIGKRLTIDAFNTFKTSDYTVFKNTVGSAADEGLFAGKADWGEKLADYNIGDAYTKTQTDDALKLKLDKTTYDAHTAAFDAFRLAVAGDKYDGTGGYLANKADKATTYTKDQVDGAIADVKAEILGGDITQALKDYDTIKEIAEWITGDKTGAVALAGQVENNKKDITTLKTTVYGANGDEGLVKDVAQNASDIIALGNDKADWGDSLADYNIGDAYTKDETNAEIKKVSDRVKTLEDTTIPNLDAAKANKTSALGSFTDFQLNSAKDAITAAFLKADGTTAAGKLTIGVITASEINALFK